MAPPRPPVHPLTACELELLGAVRRADEDQGGLEVDWRDLDEPTRAALEALIERGWVEWKDDMWLRITGAGVEALRW